MQIRVNQKDSSPTVLDSLNSSLHQAFTDNPQVYLLGEDVLDPYGGAFRVTRGLSTNFPERVLTTPISEAGFVGVATGMALRGLRPVVEIMFGDFMALIADQLVNHIAKFRWMYNDQVQLPLVIRTPMGGRRGYGPTHSQTLEKLYLGIPGLGMLAPAALSLADGSGSPGDLLYQAITTSDAPLIFIENKLQYLLPVKNPDKLTEFELTNGSKRRNPIYVLSLKGAPKPSLTIAAYGYMSELALQAALKLAYENEIFVELVIPTQLAPFEVTAIYESARKTGALLVIEEGNLTLGWGSEVIARVAESSDAQSIKFRRIAAKDLPIPSSGPLEAQVIPGIDQIIQAATQMQ